MTASSCVRATGSSWTCSAAVLRALLRRSLASSQTTLATSIGTGRSRPWLPQLRPRREGARRRRHLQSRTGSWCAACRGQAMRPPCFARPRPGLQWSSCGQGLAPAAPCSLYQTRARRRRRPSTPWATRGSTARVVAECWRHPALAIASSCMRVLLSSCLAASPSTWTSSAGSSPTPRGGGWAPRLGTWTFWLLVEGRAIGA
mmetsp:Transcript_20898/g.59018  ORF Transcript_20898/g.59018 Transcript_20898/m.59018 type:complete len:202 (-) Transcript_20898:341-946(-)